MKENKTIEKEYDGFAINRVLSANEIKKEYKRKMKKFMNKEKELIKAVKEQIMASRKNMYYQRDVTKNRTNTAFWEGVLFGEKIILKEVRKYVKAIL